MVKSIIICLDGCGIDYLESTNLPNVKTLIRKGTYASGKAVIPTVTNINNVSIVTGQYPDKHGITSNYYYDSKTGTGCYMETADYLLSETIIERAKNNRLTTAILTSKYKLLTLLNKGADYAVSAEKPPYELSKQLGKPPEIYSADINIWLMRAALHLVGTISPDLLFLSTTDYVMHKYPPGHKVSDDHLKAIDHILGDICATEPEREIFITADHGMNDKNNFVDMSYILSQENIKAEVVPIIKDKYEEHHSNMGGAAYIYIEQQKYIDKALKTLKMIDGIEEVYSRIEAASLFSLMPSRIGDIFVLADKNSVFTNKEMTDKPGGIRSHGSKYECCVPIISYSLKRQFAPCSLNLDLANKLLI